MNLHLCEISRMDKFIETESKFEVTRFGGRGWVENRELIFKISHYPYKLGKTDNVTQQMDKLALYSLPPPTIQNNL